MMRVGLLLLLLSGVAAAQTTTNKVASVVLGLSASQPTTNPNLTAKSDGTSTGVPGALHLTGCTGYRATLCAINAGDTIAASGELQVYYWSDFFGTSKVGGFTPIEWPRNPGIDESVPSGIATDCNGGTCQCVTFPDRAIYASRASWIYVAPNSVTTAAGATTVRVMVEAVCTP